MKGLFIPDVTVKMFRNASVESVAELMAEGRVYDIDYQESCEDAISRKALIERINNAEENFKVDNMDSISSDEENPFVDGVLSGVFNIRQMVAQAPSVTPTRKKGKWIRHEERKPLKYGYELIIKGKCSNCGEVFCETYKMNFCPNCGAEMESEE